MSENIHELVEAAVPQGSAPFETEGETGDAAGDSRVEFDETEALKQELDEARKEAAENQDRYLRTRADMENYKKRMERTYSEMAKSARKELLSKLLGVKDNLERALHYGAGPEANGEGIIEGVRLTQYQLDQMLSQEGVVPIEANGRAFDPRLDEAIQRVNMPNVPDGDIVQVVRKGYTLDDEVLRPGQVIVNVQEAE